MVELGLILVGIGLFFLGVGMRKFWAKEEVKAWRKRAEYAEKKYLDTLIKDKDAWKNDVEKAVEPKEYDNPFHIKPGDARKVMEATGTQEASVKWFDSGKSNYIEPQWDSEKMHNWQQFLNKVFVHGDLNQFSCSSCNDQLYILIGKPGETQKYPCTACRPMQRYKGFEVGEWVESTFTGNKFQIMYFDERSINNINAGHIKKTDETVS